MKNLLPVLLLTLLSALVFGQEQGHWFVVPTGTSLGSGNIEVAGLEPGSVDCNPDWKWDVCMIYDDFTIASTRKIDEPRQETNFQINAVKDIVAMYFTPIYSEEEPPDYGNLNISDDPTNDLSGGSSLPIYTATVRDTAFSQHDIVINDDLILSFPLDPGITSDNPNLRLEVDSGHTGFSMSADQLLDFSIIENNLSSEGLIRFNINNSNTPSNLILILKTDNLSGELEDEVTFILYEEGERQTINIPFPKEGKETIRIPGGRAKFERGRITEKILNAHDPNYIEMYDFERDRNNGDRFWYRIHFQNGYSGNSIGLATTRVKIRLPKINWWSTSEVSVEAISVAGTRITNHNITPNFINDSIVIDIPNCNLAYCVNPEYFGSKGYVELKVQSVPSLSPNFYKSCTDVFKNENGTIPTVNPRIYFYVDQNESLKEITYLVENDFKKREHRGWLARLWYKILCGDQIF